MSGYRIVVEKAKGNFSAYSPDLPGCVATGKTAEETRRNMEAAIRFHLEGCAPKVVKKTAHVEDAAKRPARAMAHA